MDAIDTTTDSPPRRCTDCGATLSGEYCPECGQRDEPLRQPVRHFLREAAAEYVGVDGRLWRTLRILFFRPGRLTHEYLEGRRTRYLGPHRMYLAASVFFFFVLTIMDPVSRVERAAVGGTRDSTSTVADRLAVIARRVDAEKHAGAVASGNLAAGNPAAGDSLATVLAAPADSSEGDDKAIRFVGREEIEAEYGSPEVAAYERGLTLRRLAWQNAVLDTLDRTRIIRPRDLDDASTLLYPDTSSVFRIGAFGIEAEGSSAPRLQQARTASERWNAFGTLARRAVSHLPLVMFLLLPVFALLLKLLYIRTNWYYVEHLIFALHVHAHAFVVLAAASLITGYFDERTWASVLSIALLAWPPAYFVLAMKHVYRSTWGRTVAKAWLVGLVYPLALLAGVAGSIWLAAEFG